MTDTSLIQKLMDEAYDKWQDNDWSKQDFRNYISKIMSREHLIAVQVGNLNYQVENGGFLQWHDNGYSMDLEDLISYCEEIGTKTCIKVKTLLEYVQDTISYFCTEAEEAMQLLTRNLFDNYAEVLRDCLWDQMSKHLSRYDQEYYDISDNFLSDVETYLAKTQEGGK